MQAIQQFMPFKIVDDADSYRELVYPLINVSSEVTSEDGANNGVWFHKGRINQDEEIIFGMSPTNYHCFLVCGDKEYHPRFSFNDGKTIKARKRSIRAGVFLRIKGLSPEELSDFQDYLGSLKGTRSPSCHVGALQALHFGAGIKIKGLKSYDLTPHQFLYDLLKNGLTNRDGQKLSVSFYTTKDKSLSAIFKEVKKFQRHFKWFYLISDFYYQFVKVLTPKRLIRYAE